MTGDEFRNRMDAILGMLKQRRPDLVSIGSSFRRVELARARLREQESAPGAVAADRALANRSVSRSLRHTPRDTAATRTEHGLSQTFNFLPIPTDVHFRFRTSRRLPEFVRSLGGHKAFVITDPGVRSSGIVDEVTARLAEHNMAGSTTGVTADSRSRLIREAVDGLSPAGPTSSWASVAAAGHSESSRGACHQSGRSTTWGYKVRNRPLSVVALPTTAATRQRVSLWSVFTDDDRKLKVAV